MLHNRSMDFSNQLPEDGDTDVWLSTLHNEILCIQQSINCKMSIVDKKLDIILASYSRNDSEAHKTHDSLLQQSDHEDDYRDQKRCATSKTHFQARV